VTAPVCSGCGAPIVGQQPVVADTVVADTVVAAVSDAAGRAVPAGVAGQALPDPSLAWEDLSAEDRRALTEMLVDKIVLAPHPHKIDMDGKRHYLIRAIPYQDPQQEAERLKAVHEARVKIVPRV
jgi:hypothetical protein